MKADMPPQQARRWVGSEVQRQEDAALLTGQARFMDDLDTIEGVHHAAILRSPHGHASVLEIDVSRALALPGVTGVLTGPDVAAMSRPMGNMITDRIHFYPCAVDKVRYFGEPVAVVVARDRYIAEDALDLIEVRYQPLPAAVDPEAAMLPGAPVLHADLGGNEVQHRSFHYGDADAAFREASCTVKVKTSYPRVNSTPMETYGVVASWDAASGGYHVRSNFQGPFALHPIMCEALGVRSHQLRLTSAPASGGSFGIKHGIYSYLVLMALASRKLGVAVKWIEDRLEHLAASSAASGRVTTLEGAFSADGMLTGLRFLQIENVGAYVRVPEPAALYRMHATINGPYLVRNIAVNNHVVVTNQVPSGLNRGFGGPQFYYPLERLMDVAAKRLGMDPAELRRRNLVPPTAMPYECPAGSVLDSGDYPAALQLALDKLGYASLREEVQRRRREGRLCGIGLAVAVETSASNMAYVGLAVTAAQRARSLPKSGAAATARLMMDTGGSVIVHVDSLPNGQGHQTVVAQVVADELGMDPGQVEVVTQFDTRDGIWSIVSGNYGNRFSTTVVSAVALAARKAAHKLKLLAAAQLKLPVEDIELAEGYALPRNRQAKGVALRRLAAQLHWHSSDLPEGVDGPISEIATFASDLMTVAGEDDRVRSSLAYSFQCDLAMVEVERDTGKVHVERYVTMHDVGAMLNPVLVDGQVLGGFAHGYGAAMTERLRYDEQGTLLTGTFQDYMCPTAPELPRVEIGHMCTPGPHTLLGAKGLGDGSSMISPVVMANAIADATGLEDIVPPFTPSRLWSMLQGEDPDAGPSHAQGPAAGAASGSQRLAGSPLSGQGTVDLSADPERVFALLVDPQQLAAVIPGCKSMRELSPGTYQAELDIRVAGIGGVYQTELVFSDVVAPASLRLQGRAEGKLGSGVGDVQVSLSPSGPGRSRLHYDYQAGVSGKVAGFAHRMLDSVTRVLIASFFESLETRLTGQRRGWLPSLIHRLGLLLRAWRS